MSKLNNRYCLETDELFKTTGKYTEKFFKSILPTVFILIHHWELLLQLYDDGNFPTKNTFCIKTNTNAYKSVS